MSLKSKTLFVFVVSALYFTPFISRYDLAAQVPTPRKPAVTPVLQGDYPHREVKITDLNPEFLQMWDFNRNLGLKGASGSSPKLVRMVYLVPSDKVFRMDYEASLKNAILDLQSFYQNELGNGNRFTLNSPIVEIYQTPHNSAWYSTNPRAAQQPSWFLENALEDGFSLSGGGFNDPNNRWVYYIDVDPACGQFMGGTAGIALMSSNDLRGLTGEPYVITCPSSPPDNAPVGRWIGGAGHELAHAFDIPHPPGCDQGNCTGGTFAQNSLMWLGFRIYPNTYFLPADEQLLLASGFFSNDYPVSVSGRVTGGDGRGIFGTRISMTDQGGSVRYVTTNPFGYYRFQNVTAGQTYILNPQHKWFEFAPIQISPASDLTGIDIIGQ